MRGWRDVSKLIYSMKGVIWCYVLDLGRIIATIQPNQHAVSVLQHIGKGSQEVSSFVAVEVAWTVSVSWPEQYAARLSPIPMLEPRLRMHLRLKTFSGLLSHSRPSSYVPNKPRHRTWR